MFYYLLVGASKEEQQEFQLLELQDYHYLKQVTLIRTLYVSFGKFPFWILMESHSTNEGIFIEISKILHVRADFAAAFLRVNYTF